MSFFTNSFVRILSQHKNSKSSKLNVFYWFSQALLTLSPRFNRVKTELQPSLTNATNTARFKRDGMLNKTYKKKKNESVPGTRPEHAQSESNGRARAKHEESTRKEVIIARGKREQARLFNAEPTPSKLIVGVLFFLLSTRANIIQPDTNLTQNI